MTILVVHQWVMVVCRPAEVPVYALLTRLPADEDTDVVVKVPFHQNSTYADTHVAVHVGFCKIPCSCQRSSELASKQAAESAVRRVLPLSLVSCLRIPPARRRCLLLFPLATAWSSVLYKQVKTSTSYTKNPTLLSTS